MVAAPLLGLGRGGLEVYTVDLCNTGPCPGDAFADGSDIVDRAQHLRRLHRGPDVLVLPDVWDAGSAALVGQLPGVRALGTTSTGMAAAQGLPDGEWLTLDQLLTVVGQITRAVPLPVCVDLESGYGRTSADVTDSVASLIELGAVGIDIADRVPTDSKRLIAPDEHAERIAATRAAGDELGVPIVINARTDVFQRGVGTPGDRLDGAITRLRRYRQAGADSVAVPGFPDSDSDLAVDQIRHLVAALDDVPVGLLSDPALPSLAELRELRVRRLSVGSALYRLGMAAVLDAAGDLLATGDHRVLAGAAALTDAGLAELLPDPERQ